MTSSGELKHRVGFFKRSAIADEFGNPEGEYPAEPEFIVSAKLAVKLGGETVLAARLAGQQTSTITVRQSSRTRLITTDWMVKEMRTDTVWNIRSGPADPDDDGAYFQFLCQSGVAP